LPEMASKIEDGSLSLSNAATAQGFFRREEGQKRKTYTVDEKRKIVNSLVNKSKSECEKTLAAISPASALPQERTKIITDTKTELYVVLDQSVLDQLNKIKGIIAHSHPYAGYAEVIKFMADITLEKTDPVAKAERAAERAEKKSKYEKSKSESENLEKENSEKGHHSEREILESQDIRNIDPKIQDSEKKNLEKEILEARNLKSENLNLKSNDPETQRQKATEQKPNEQIKQYYHPYCFAAKPPKREYIPAPIKHQVILRDKGSCTFVDAQGRRCNSRHRVDVDHIVPIALGGTNELSNLRCLCRGHNLWEAISKLGEATMREYLSFR
jgi:5-methylcytosine-specific restriction endonuclease McrA